VTIELTKIGSAELIRSLRSTICPLCGGEKVVRQTLCKTHYYALPVAMRKALYAMLGSGYRESVIEAIRFLGKTEFILPDDTRK
jgi:hypothetical protein